MGDTMSRCPDVHRSSIPVKRRDTLPTELAAQWEMTFHDFKSEDFRVGLAIVGRVGMWVVAQSGQHGGDDSHVPHNIRWDLTHPLGQCLHVDGLDDLVCGALHPGKTEKRVVFRPPLPKVVFSITNS
ncbi:hypothetical protein EYF80_018688 [Liparis tanakae]|uniref:Uncharacterized protein n=1 Tax=Liparis tanakae TaxID=230148 RepID=A0A4Z2HZ65_9TELE|nr:hypothetical protein EYF80_018688 [Liparis tanakae]